MIEIVMKNSAGVLDVQTVKDSYLVKQALIDMIEDCVEIYPGDTFEVNEIED